MLAQDIKTGATFRDRDHKGRMVSGWTATGDAVIEDGAVHVVVQYYDGGDGVRIWPFNTEVPVYDK